MNVRSKIFGSNSFKQESSTISTRVLFDVSEELKEEEDEEELEEGTMGGDGFAAAPDSLRIEAVNLIGFLLSGEDFIVKSHSVSECGWGIVSIYGQKSQYSFFPPFFPIALTLRNSCPNLCFCRKKRGKNIEKSMNDGKKEKYEAYICFSPAVGIMGLRVIKTQKVSVYDVLLKFVFLHVDVPNKVLT